VGCNLSTKPAVTFPATENHHLMAGTKLLLGGVGGNGQSDESGEKIIQLGTCVNNWPLVA